MLIRELRDDELYKRAKLSSLAFSYAVNIEEKKKVRFWTTARR